MTPREKLQALPKAALIELALRLAHERNAMRANIAARDDWRNWGARETRDAAAIVLAGLFPDPDAEQHRDVLAHELDARRAPIVRPRRPGPRCDKGTKACGRPLNAAGLCARCDHRATRVTTVNREATP